MGVFRKCCLSLNIRRFWFGSGGIGDNEGVRLATLLFLGAWLAMAQDARSIVARAVAADDRSDQLARSYTYKLRDEIRELDAAGQVKTVHSTVDEVLYIAGKRYFRPVEKDGKPISAADARREQAKLDRAAAEASRLNDTEHEKRIEAAERERAKQRAEFKDLPDAFNFRLLGEATIEGRRCWKISAEPRPEYHGAFQGVFHSVEGKLWIDEEDLNWARVEAEALRPFSLGWLLARVAAGTHLTYEMQRVNDEMWAPARVSLTASARLLLLRKVHVDQELTFSDYRKFQSDSRIVSTNDLP